MRKNFLNRQNKISLILIIIIILLFLILAILSPKLMNYGFFLELLKRSSEVIVLAVGTTIVFISGGFDLSFGSIMALSGALTGIIYKIGIPFPLAFLIGILACIGIGLANGFFVVRVKLDPFIVTLAMAQIVRSIVYGITSGKTVTSFPDSFNNISEISISKIPVIFIIAVFISIVANIFMRKTIVGRYLYAMGGNQLAAYCSGIYINKLKILVYSLSGFLAGISGFLLATRTNSVPPNTGLYTPLEVVTAVVVGGTLISGGDGSIFGSFLGVFTMILLVNVFNILGINPFWNLIVLGVIMIFVVSYESFSRIFSFRFNRLKIESNGK